jgi:hypothetical protein
MISIAECDPALFEGPTDRVDRAPTGVEWSGC